MCRSKSFTMQFKIDFSDGLLLHIRRMRLTRDMSTYYDALPASHKGDLLNLESIRPSVCQEELAAAHFVLSAVYDGTPYENATAALLRDTAQTTFGTATAEPDSMSVSEMQHDYFVVPQRPAFQALRISGREQLAKINSRGFHPPPRSDSTLQVSLRHRITVNSRYGEHACWINSPPLPTKMDQVWNAEEADEKSVSSDVEGTYIRHASNTSDKTPTVELPPLPDGRNQSAKEASSVMFETPLPTRPSLTTCQQSLDSGNWQHDSKVELESDEEEFNSSSSSTTASEPTSSVQIWQYNPDLNDDDEDDEEWFARHLASLQAEALITTSAGCEGPNDIELPRPDTASLPTAIESLDISSLPESSDKDGVVMVNLPFRPKPVIERPASPAPAQLFDERPCSSLHPSEGQRSGFSLPIRRDSRPCSPDPSNTFSPSVSLSSTDSNSATPTDSNSATPTDSNSTTPTEEVEECPFHKTAASDDASDDAASLREHKFRLDARQVDVAELDRSTALGQTCRKSCSELEGQGFPLSVAMQLNAATVLCGVATIAYAGFVAYRWLRW